VAKKPTAPPTLTIVDPSNPNPLAPPPTLAETGRELWNSLHRDFVIEDSSGLQMLFQVCSAADQAAEYSATIARDGATIRGSSGLRDHPLIKHELAARAFVVRALHKMGFDIVTPRAEAGRPTGDYRGNDL